MTTTATDKIIQKSVPKEPVLDSALALLREGNDFIFSRCRKYHSDIFQTRLLGKKQFVFRAARRRRNFIKKGV